MFLTAVICTYNRREDLAEAIQSLIAQTLAPDLFEILVVDNGSSDGTQELVTQLKHNVKNLRYIQESKKGLSYARNRALAEARGTHICWLDDDAIAAPDWLSQISAALQRHPDCVCLGGKVSPRWPEHFNHPSWLGPELFVDLSLIDWGPEPRELLDSEWLAGVNFTASKQILESIGGFSTELGRKGKLLLSGEEIYFQRQLRLRGHKIMYEPKIEVLHKIPVSRLKKQWFYQRAYGQGISDGMIFLMEEQPSYFRRMLKVMRTLGAICLSLKDLKSLLGNARTASEVKKKCSLFARLGHCRVMIWRMIY